MYDLRDGKQAQSDTDDGSSGSARPKLKCRKRFHLALKEESIQPKSVRIRKEVARDVAAWKDKPVVDSDIGRMVVEESAGSSRARRIPLLSLCCVKK